MLESRATTFITRTLYKKKKKKNHRHLRVYLHSHKNTAKHVYIEIRGIINEPTQIYIPLRGKKKKNVLNTIKTIFRPGGKKRRIPEIITLQDSDGKKGIKKKSAETKRTKTPTR